MNNKLIELLLTLSKKNIVELLEFSKIALSGLKEDEKNLFEKLIQQFKKEKTKFDDIAFFTKNPLKKTNANTIRNRFLKVINLYIHTASFDINNAFQSDYLAQWYSKNNIDKNYRTYLTKKSNYLKKAPYDNLKNFYLFKQAENEIAIHRNKRKRNNTIKEMGKHLDIFYVENKLRILSENVNRQKIIYTDKEENAILDILLKEDVIIDNLGVKIYKNVYKLLTEKDDDDDKKYFNSLKELLSTSSDKNLAKDYQKAIYIYLLNHCSTSVSEGYFDYATQYIDIIEILADKKILFEKNILSKSKFKNTTTSAIIAERYTWLEKFLTTYKDNLLDTEKDDVYNYCCALLKFHLGKYKEALSLIDETKFKDIYFKLSMYKLRLKILDAIKDFDKFSASINSLKMFIYRNKDLPKKAIEQSKLFCKVVENIVLDEKKININELKGKLAAMDYFWILNR